MGKNPKSTRYIPFRPSAGQEKQLRRLSKETGLSVSDLVRLCLDRDLDELEQNLKRKEAA